MPKFNVILHPVPSDKVAYWYIMLTKFLATSFKVAAGGAILVLVETNDLRSKISWKSIPEAEVGFKIGS